MAWIPYDSYLKGMKTGEFTAFVDHDGDDFYIMLVTNSYVPDRAAHQYQSDLTNEVTGTNYTAGGNICANPAVTVSGNVITWDASDPATWAQSASGFSNARYAILVKHTGTAATSNLIAYNNFGSDQGNVAGDFAIELAADGISTLGSS